jgi:deoxyribodipyrimidine photo-lyase
MPHSIPHSSGPTLTDRALVWFRRDLRLLDHTALRQALQRSHQVWCCFVFDTEILDALPRADRRVDFIHRSVLALDHDLRQRGGGLIVLHGPASEELPRLARRLGVQAVYTHRDYEPAARRRDATVLGHLAEAGIVLHSLKDQVIFDTDEVMTGAGTAFGVFTPYRTAWLRRLGSLHERLAGWADPASRTPDSAFVRLAARPAGQAGLPPTLADLDFLPAPIPKIEPGEAGAQRGLAEFLTRIDAYADRRDFPALKGPSYLSVHLRFGTLSIRQLVAEAWQRSQGGSKGAEVWLSELIWREFYMQLLHHHPALVDHCFRPEFDKLHWEHGRHAEAHFAAWCEGRTGYPIIDAGMRQLNQTGYMHNRLRMLTASFLTKDLGLDWRRGERYFAEHLNDYDLAANNGGWQWAASTGCDAQPWFRIFNPVTQSRKFDPEGRFILRYVPELAPLAGQASLHEPWTASGGPPANYPTPLVDHAAARERTLARFEAVRAGR